MTEAIVVLAAGLAVVLAISDVVASLLQVTVVETTAAWTVIVHWRAR